VKSVEEAELETILQAGWATGGRVTQMAALLGISRTTVWRRLRKAGIHRPFSRPATGPTGSRCTKMLHLETIGLRKRWDLEPFGTSS